MERNPSRLVTVFGGSGFVGRYLVRALARGGWRVRVAVRRPDLVGYVKPMGGVGQVHPIQANVRDEASVRAAVAHADAVVNLVGILSERGRQTFDAVHRDAAGRVAQAARQAGATQFVHMSALGADPQSPSLYARSKAAGEAAVREAFPEAVVVRPSIVFGPEDRFFNRFAGMAKISPVVPMVGADTRFQPVFVGDVGTFMARAVDSVVPPGRAYELGGPDVRTFRELMRFVLDVTGRRRLLVALPFGLARVQAQLLSILPNPPLTTDQVELLRTDNVVSEDVAAEGRTLAAAHLVPRSMAAIVPTYLWTYRRGGQFAEPGTVA